MPDLANPDRLNVTLVIWREVRIHFVVSTKESNMRVSSSSTGNSVTLHIHSVRLDAVVARELRSSLGEAVAATFARTVIDMSEVLFLDSSGLGALLGVSSAALPGKLVLTGVMPAVRTVLRRTRVDRAFRIIE
jgi:anti-sigma B factor antagonist